MVYLYLNNYMLCNGRKNMPMCIFIRYRFNRTLLFIVSINLYYGCNGHLKIKYKSIKHKQIYTIHVIVLHKCLIVFFFYPLQCMGIFAICDGFRLCFATVFFCSCFRIRGNSSNRKNRISTTRSLPSQFSRVLASVTRPLPTWWCLSPNPIPHRSFPACLAGQ